MTIVKWEQLVESFKFNVNLRSKIFLFFFEVFLNFSEPIDSVLKNEIILLEDDFLCILTASWQSFMIVFFTFTSAHKKLIMLILKIQSRKKEKCYSLYFVEL